jgi:uncharacterized protein YqhQ
MRKSQQNKETNTTAPACRRKTTIGGQALIEGLMMIGPDKKAMAVRKPDGTILIEYLPMTRFTGIANVPFIRGSVRMFRQLVTGTKALLRSAEFVEEDEKTAKSAAGVAAAPAVENAAAAEAAPASEVAATAAAAEAAPTAEGVSTADTAAAAEAAPAAEDAPAAAVQVTAPGKENQPATGWRARLSDRVDKFIDSHSELMLYVSAILGILFSVVLFILVPNLLTGLIRMLTGIGSVSSRSSTVLLNLIEGAIRITLFVGYLALASRMAEIQRVWMYHGAEHKTIACYEADMPLTVENVRKFSRFHPRCGTAFMFLVIIVSIIVFSLIGWWNPWINLLVRFALVPLVAGIAYEIIRIAGRYDVAITRFISAPGLWLQRLTTAEPNDSMLEVAIAAMEAVLPQKADSDKW